MRIKTSILIIVIAILNYIPVFSGDNEAGIYSHFQLNNHIADFGRLPGIPGCCPSYNDGTGAGLSGGLFYKKSIDNIWSWQMRSGVSFINGEMRRQEHIGNTYDENLNTVEVLSEYELSTSLSFLEFSPMISARLFDFPLEIGIGGNAGYIFSSHFAQKENIISPQNARFDNGLQTRDSYDGSIDKISRLYLAGFGEISYKFELYDNLYLYPSVGYSYNFNNLAENTDWNAHSLRFGVALSYDFPESSPEIEPDTALPPRLPESTLSAYVHASGLNDENVEDSIVIIKVEEFLSRQLYPLLPYIFFSENSSIIPPKYIRISGGDADRFAPQEKFINSNVMNVYYNTLNIIGYRMRNKPEAIITLTGCNADTRGEKDNLNLSQRRAAAVKSYLVTRWGIEAERIETISRNLPENFTENKSAVHNQENRRVEITSSDAEILSPLFIYDTLRQTTPPVVKIRTLANSSEGVYSWQLTANQNSDDSKNELFSVRGFTAPDSVHLWNLQQDKSSIPRTEKPLEIGFRITDNSDSTVTAKSTIPVEQITIRKKLRRRMDDKYIDEYRLIMFGYATPRALEQHRKILGLLCENITGDSRIIIRGYTDNLGSDDFNKELSAERAANIAESLPCRAGEVKSRGEGENDRHNNDLPEGRFYNRTVIVRVETPIKR